MPLPETGTAFNVTSTSAIGKASTPGHCLGFYVNSTSSGTIVFRDGGSGGTALGTITPAVGFHRYPFNFSNGLHVTIANTLDVTIFVQQG